MDIIPFGEFTRQSPPRHHGPLLRRVWAIVFIPVGDLRGNRPVGTEDLAFVGSGWADLLPLGIFVGNGCGDRALSHNVAAYDSPGLRSYPGYMVWHVSTLTGLNHGLRGMDATPSGLDRF